MNPALWLTRTAIQTPHSPALMVGTDLEADYATFAGRVAGLAGALQKHGLIKGDRVALFLTNSTTYLEIMYAAWFLGCGVVPINAKLHPKEVGWILQNSGAKVVFTDHKKDKLLGEVTQTGLLKRFDIGSSIFDEMVAEVPLVHPVSMARDDMAWLFYTSGTTGRPKGVMISCGNIAAMVLGYFADVDDVKSDDAVLYAAPMSHGAGLYNFMHIMRGCRHIIPRQGGFEPAGILELAEEVGHLTLFAAPTMVKRLVEFAKMNGKIGAGIKTIIYGGGPMYLEDIIEASRIMGPRFVQIYGQGESPMCITALSRELIADRSHPKWRERLASVGRAQSVVEVAIFDQENQPYPRGQIGEIAVKGASVMTGYWENPQATAAVIQDGWLLTGDLGVMDDEGFITLQDRSKDMIISGGSNIYPREVEEVILRHPDIQEVSVVGRQHPEWGEEVVAFITLRRDCTVSLAELDQLCLDEIARFKRPKAYFKLSELPKNNYGKILKTTLRQILEDGKLNALE